MPCVCYVAIPRGTVGWSAECECGIFWSYSLAFLYGWILGLTGTTHVVMWM